MTWGDKGHASLKISLVGWGVQHTWIAQLLVKWEPHSLLSKKDKNLYVTE